MSRARLRRTYWLTFAAWRRAGGVEATMRGEPNAVVLARVLGDLDEHATCLDLGWDVPPWRVRVAA